MVIKLNTVKCAWNVLQTSLKSEKTYSKVAQKITKKLNRNCSQLKRIL